MTEPVLIAILSATLPAAAGLVAGVVSSRLGAGRTGDLDYHLKRVQLVQEMKKLQDAGFPGHDWSALDRAVSEVLAFLDSISVAGAAQVERAVVPRRRVLDAILLPHPQSPFGWVATVVYYLYGFTTVVYLAFGAQWLVTGKVEQQLGEIVIPGTIGVLLLTLGARIAALRLHQRALERRRQIAGGTGAA